MSRIEIKPQGLFGFFADMLAVPVMALSQGTVLESPQRTHRWNNYHLPVDSVAHLNDALMIVVQGDKDAIHRSAWWDLRFHIPALGGWSNYAVVAPPVEQEVWYVGWRGTNFAGVSRIPLQGYVRLLRGPDQVSFFGLNARGEQIALSYQASGTIGKSGPLSRIPLL